MSGATPEPRTAVMILVEASWLDNAGTLRSVTARMGKELGVGIVTDSIERGRTSLVATVPLSAARRAKLPREEKIGLSR
jgi:hypothetical protein